jgi:hypothetical protein
MDNMPHMSNNQVVEILIASLVALGAVFIYFNAVLQSLVNDDRHGNARLAAAAIACLSLAVTAFQADRLRFLLFSVPILATHKAVVPSACVLSVPNLFWAGIPLLTHGLVMLFRNELQEYRFHKSSYAAWHPDISDWFIGIVLALGGGALLWQWHPTYLPAAVGWAIAAALCTVVSIVLWRWSAKE